MKLVIVHNIIAPYRIPLFNRLAAEPGIDLHVLFMAESEANRHWDVARLKGEMRFSHEVLSGFHLRRGESTIHVNPGLFARLATLRPDVVIITSLSAASAICLVHRRLGGGRVVSWWGGSAQTEAGIGSVKWAWRRWAVPRMDAFLCYSRAAADYVHGMGARADRIFAAGNVTFDAEEFHQRVDLARPRAAEWRQRMELTDRRMVLSVGQLVPRKNHQGLLKAFSMIQKSLGPAALVIVGNGPLKADLERAAASGLSHVIFTGNVQPDELPLYYAAADLFVDLSLRDHWSQVVGEAMAAGLPALVSDADHACELVENGKSGFIVDANDLPAVSSLALSLLASRPKAEAIGEAAFDAVRMHDVRHTLEAFVSCLEGLDVSLLPTPGTTAQGATR